MSPPTAVIRTPLLVLALALLGLLLPAAASATRGPCIPGSDGPACEIWTGEVGPVDDGDTINVDIDGDGTSRMFKIRLTGIQAMELRSYSRKQGRSGECHSVEATERLEELIRRANSRVRIAAISSTSTTGARGRLRRSISIRQDKRWVDVGAVLVREGLALWFPNAAEWAWNGSYSRLAEEAASRGIGIWSQDTCGAGPAQSSRLRLKVKWNADDDDSRNINGEWVRISNPDPVNAVALGGWWFRDSHLRRYTFPDGATVPAGGSIKLHVGRGTNGPTTFYWGLAEAVFENPSDGAAQIGDGGYLFDPDGDLRAHAQYPCRVSCSEPLAGKVEIRAAYRAPEAITVRNISTERISLDEYEIESAPWFYEFERDTVLLPGQEFVLWTQRAPEPGGALSRSWNHGVYLLSDRKDIVTLRNPLGMPVTCHAWGGESCPAV